MILLQSRRWNVVLNLHPRWWRLTQYTGKSYCRRHFGPFTIIHGHLSRRQK